MQGLRMETPDDVKQHVARQQPYYPNVNESSTMAGSVHNISASPANLIDNQLVQQKLAQLK